jgi:phage-related protein
MSWRVEFFVTDRGSSPPGEFLLSLPARPRAKIGRALELLEEFGLVLGEPYIKSMAGHRGLYELRVRSGSDAFRLFFCVPAPQHAVVLHGTRKKTDRTPKRDLETAAGRMVEYLRRQ